MYRMAIDYLTDGVSAWLLLSVWTTVTFRPFPGYLQCVNGRTEGSLATVSVHASPSFDQWSRG